MNKNTILVLIIIAIAVSAYLLFINEDVITPAASESATEMESTDYVGMTTIEAEAKAQADQTMFRVVEIDGEPQVTTRDFQAGRINATVASGVVTEYSIESMDPTIEVDPVTETEVNDTIIGMTTTEAEMYAADNMIDFRVGTIDGEGLPVTLDYRVGRITAEIENDVVVGYTVE